MVNIPFDRLIECCTYDVNLRLVRIRIFELSVQEQLQSGPLVGQIEVDESYFGARRVKGKRGRGARGKTIVFGLLKRGYKVYTQIIEKCDRNTLQTIIRDLCINRNSHQKPTFHPLGDFLNPALALLGQGLKKSPIGQKLDFANHPYLCKGLY